MIADLSLYCRRVFIAAAAVAGLGIAGSSHSAQAHVATSPVVSPAAQSQGVDRAIVVADNRRRQRPWTQEWEREKERE